MGRTRAKTKTSRGLPVKDVDPSEPKSKPTIPALLAKTQELLTRCDYDLATKFIQRVLSQEPSNSEALECLGIVQIETGDIEAAKKTFAALVMPNTMPPMPSAHLYMAQLSDDDPQASLSYYQAAVDILVNRLKGKEKASVSIDGGLEDSETRDMAIRALIGMVEIYMTDLCFEPVAESQCESYLATALQLDPDSPDALQSLASVRMSQNREDEAKVLVQRAWEGWRKINEDNSISPAPSALLALTRLCLELSLFQEALEILQVVLSVDDEEVEAWYLQGWCFVLMGGQAKEKGEKFEELTWPELLQDARDCLETCQMLHTKEEHPDAELLGHVKELIAELEAAGIHPSPLEAAGEDGADEDGWTDADIGDSDSDSDSDVDMES